MPPIIDIHTHAWTDALAEKALPALLAASGGQLTAFYNGTVGGLSTEMDRTGVDISVVQPVATKPAQVAAINDWAASAGNDHIVMFGSMHPDLEDPAAEIERMASLGIRGFKMHPEHQAFAPDDSRLAPMWRAAIKHRMILFSHAGADVLHPTVHGTADSFARLIDAWPDLTVVLAHLGGFNQWQQVAEHLQGRDVWLDTAYTLGHLPDAEFVELVRAHGTDRVLFGSDGPWTDAAVEIAHMSRLGFSDSELAGILGGNAQRLLGV
jgi:predicted TIM-barrel fold metal-dependent hydrolase